MIAVLSGSPMVAKPKVMGLYKENSMRYFAALVLALCVTLGVMAEAADKKYTVGVSMPSATHGWMANANYWANKAK